MRIEFELEDALRWLVGMCMVFVVPVIGIWVVMGPDAWEMIVLFYCMISFFVGMDWLSR